MSDSAERLIDRLDRLERNLKRTRLFGAAALVVVGGLVLAAAQVTPSVVEAKDFILRDSEGRLRGRLSMDSSMGGPALEFYDEKLPENAASLLSKQPKPVDRDRYVVRRSHLGLSGLYLSAGEGRGSASMVAQDTGGQIVMNDATGKGGIEIVLIEGHGPAVTLIDADQNIRFRLDVDRTDPYLKMVGFAGKVLFQAPMPGEDTQPGGADSR